MRLDRLCALGLLLLMSRSDAFAQQRAPLPRGQVEIDGAYRTASQTLVDSASPVINAETGSMTATYDVPAGPGFSVSGAIRLWKNLGVGAGFSQFSADVDTHATASLPHPFVFGRPRNIEGDAPGVSRDESAFSIQARVFVPLTPRLTLSVFGGPAHVSVSQDVVTRVNYTETYPYDSATYQGVDLDHEEASKWGVSGGLDLAYFFSRSFGAGAGFRYGGGNVEFTSMSGAGLESSIGGFDITAGFRIRF